MRVMKEAKETRTVEETYAVVCTPENDATEIELEIRVVSNSQRVNRITEGCLRGMKRKLKVRWYREIERKRTRTRDGKGREQMKDGVKKYSNNEALITTSINYELLITA